MPTKSTRTPGRIRSRSGGRAAAMMRAMAPWIFSHPARSALAIFLALATSALCAGDASAQGASSSTPSPTPAAPAPLLMSRQLAEAEGLHVGSIVQLASSADGHNGRTFRITGIYEPTPDPQRLGQLPRRVRLHLPDLLDLTRPA